ncbi:MAG: DUF188 domain-containing protein [Desulfuromonadales bacterium]
MIKDILFRAAERKKVRLILVANQPLRTPASAYIDSMVVAAGFDVADDKIVKTTMDTFGYMTDDVKKIMGGRKTFITSADGMSPDNPMLKVLAEIPLAPWIKGHSIIGVQGDGDPKLGDDGVVKYRAAPTWTAWSRNSLSGAITPAS